ncbi:MAG: 16S rRNA (guanine(527)-N(7))-methyltransferase RsmG [Mariniphaga sp.]|nr:16S rRNA (guanine(527)-N(7))-methyltransferase RsmG [Mariniphaga sp.]MDD4225846.1 16S rRNA (guanine(527)-N(7))-methyltransferase RsmG [Mariniphaga sp.]MDD4424906.1 16S rRNA (guanine(527)-N(7))-methyltransferase RsmG [Mariniphaga sp.]
MEIIKKYFSGLSVDQMAQFEQLEVLYENWNAKINVISRKDIGRLYERHVLHSLAIARFIRFVPGTKVLDVGTGGGFPGIPLAIFFPGTRFHLVDSVGKKIKVVSEIINSLGITNVTSQQIRAEQLRSKYDFIVSRAVTNLPEFVGWIGRAISSTHHNAIPNGVIFLKGGNLEGEIKPFRKTAFIQEISGYFDEEFFKTKKLVYLPL